MKRVHRTIRGRYIVQSLQRRAFFCHTDIPQLKSSFCSSGGLFFRKHGQVSSCVWLEGKREGLFPARIDPTASLPTPARLRPAASPWAAPTRPARGLSGFLLRQVPGHALHEKGLQRQRKSSHWSAARNKERISSL